MAALLLITGIVGEGREVKWRLHFQWLIQVDVWQKLRLYKRTSYTTPKHKLGILKVVCTSTQNGLFMLIFNSGPGRSGDYGHHRVWLGRAVLGTVGTTGCGRAGQSWALWASQGVHHTVLSQGTHRCMALYLRSLSKVPFYQYTVVFSNSGTVQPHHHRCFDLLGLLLTSVVPAALPPGAGCEVSQFKAPCCMVPWNEASQAGQAGYSILWKGTKGWGCCRGGHCAVGTLRYWHGVGPHTVGHCHPGCCM